MARAKSSGRSKTALAIEEINQGIDMLRKQVAKVEDLKSEGFPYRDAFRARAELQIRESIRRIFGDKSPEFQAHQHYKLRTNTPTEITETLSMLNGLISKLESKKLDLLGLSPGEPTASPPQSGTPQSAPHLTLVPPAQVTVTPLVPPVVPPPATMSISLATNAATPASATSTPPAPSAQPSAVAAAPPNSPPVQPSSVAFAPGSAMPPPPLPTQTTAFSPSVSPVQSAPSSVQRTETPPYASPQSDHATAPVSSPSAPIPTSPSPVQPGAPKRHLSRTHAMPTAPPAPESPSTAAAVPPTPVSAMPPPADATEAALTANAPSAIQSQDGPEPDPAAGYRARPRAISKPAPAPTVEHLVQQAGQPTRSAARTDAPKPTPSGSAGEPDPLDLVRKICTRFHRVVRQLRLRRDYRATLDVEDEYDVQDLFHALLRLELDEVSTEEWMPSYTDCASRTTFVLHRGAIAIVVKKTRPGVGAREIAEQLQEDAKRYAARENCRTLFCFVYDPEGRIGNPRGLEMDLTSVSDRYTVELLVAPK